MAPRGVNWRRPYTSIYNDNYRYGTNLYSGTLSGIEKKYNDSLSKTQLRSDRPDLSLSTFASSNLSSAPAIGQGGGEQILSSTSLPASPTRDLTSSSYHASIFESMLSSALHSSYAADVADEKMVDRRPASRNTDVSQSVVEITRPSSRMSEAPKMTTWATEAARTTSSKTPEAPVRPTSLYDDAVLFTPKKKINETTELDETSSKRKKKVGREVVTPDVLSPPQNGPSNSISWKDQCRDLQSQVDILTQAMSDVSNKLKGELSTLKTKLHTEVTDLHVSLEQSSQQSNDLQRTVKKQANQLMEMQTAYEDLQRHLQDSLEEVGGWQRRSQTLRKEMDRLRFEVEETLQKSNKEIRA